VRVGAGWPLRDDQAGLGDPIEEQAVAGRVAPVDSAGEHGDRRPPGGEGPAVGGGVDAEGAARDHRPASFGEAVGQVGRHVVAVGGAGPRADHGDRALARLAQAERATDPHALRWVGVAFDRIRDRPAERDQLVQLGGPLVVLGGDDACPQPGRRRDGAGGCRCYVQCGHASGGGLAEPGRDRAGPDPGQRLDRPDRANQLAEVAAAGLGQVREDDPGGPDLVDRLRPGGPGRSGRRGRGGARSRKRGHGVPPMRSSRASSTSDLLGTVRPARSAIVQATRRTRS